MSRYAGLVRQQTPQQLPASHTPEERDFFLRAVQAQQQPKPSHQEVIAAIRSRDQQEARQEREWKQRFEQWWARRSETLNRASHTRRLRFYRTMERFGPGVNTLTLEEWKQIQSRYKFRCAYCQQRRPLTKDHIVPISKGGFHTKLNVIPACQSCNSSKGNRPAHLYKPTLIPF